MDNGRHFLQIPGPTNIPDRVLRAISQATIDHRGTEFSQLALEVIEGLRAIVGTSAPIMIYPGSGTGAWEAALVNTLSLGDKVLVCETGHFARLWAQVAEKLGLDVTLLPGDWRHGVDAIVIENALSEDASHEVRAVLVVHNETSTGATSSILDIRKALDRANHPALLIVDTISSLGSMPYSHDNWGVDVTVAASQKGLMLPPGLAFNIAGEKALYAARSARLSKSYWEWDPLLEANTSGFFPYTPATNLLFGLRESIAMIFEEGLANVFARHQRLAEATRRSVRAWGLEILCANPDEYSNSLTAVLLSDDGDAEHVREVIRERFNISLGTGLGKLRGRVFRIGHLGDLNDVTVAGVLAGVEMGLIAAGVSLSGSGVAASIEYLMKESCALSQTHRAE